MYTCCSISNTRANEVEQVLAINFSAPIIMAWRSPDLLEVSGFHRGTSWLHDQGL